MTTRADESTLDLLHAGLAAALQKRLDSGDPLTAAEVTAFAKFLKDNNITALPTSTRMTPLAAGLEALNVERDESVVDLGRFRTKK